MRKVEAFFSVWLDRLSEYLAGRKGLLPLLGTALIILNLIFAILFPGAYITRIDLLLHLGLVVTIFGLVLARAL
ncbi:MAG: hypothetical protein GWN62_12635 [Aliifodinibius sp.]|nr:hypothetical protein [Fodinibius sp.]